MWQIQAFLLQKRIVEMKKSKSRNLKMLENDQRQAETWEEFTTEWLLLCLLGTFLLGGKYSFVAFKKVKNLSLNASILKQEKSLDI